MDNKREFTRDDWIAPLLLAAYAIAAVVVAARLEVHYYDTSEYLVAALSLTDDRLAYPPHRSLLFTVLLLPLTSIPPETALYTRAPYLLAVALTTVFLWLFHRWLRMTFAPRMAALGLLLLIVNPLVIHYGPFLMHDLPTALAFTAVAMAYLEIGRKGSANSFRLATRSPSSLTSEREIQRCGGRACREPGFSTDVNLVPEQKFPRQAKFDTAHSAVATQTVANTETQRSRNGYMVAGIGAAILSLMRYNFLTIVAIFVVAEILSAVGSRPHRLSTPRFWLWLVAFPVVAHFAVLTTVFAVKYRSWHMGWSMVYKIYHDHPTFTAFANTDAWYELLLYVPQMLTWPLTLVTLVGVVSAIRLRRAVDLFCVASSILFFGVHATIVKHNECRYLIPILPAVYFLILRGVQQIARRGYELAPTLAPYFSRVSRGDVRGQRFVGILLIVLLTCPVANAVKEWRRFRDPIFTTPYHQRILAYIRDHATIDAPLYFSGFMAPLYPRDYFHYRFDDFFSIFHFEVPQIYAFTRRVPKLLDKIADSMPPEALLLELARQQAMVVRLFAHKTNCLNLPPRPPPITVTRYRFQEFPGASASLDREPDVDVQQEGDSTVRRINASADESVAMVYQRDGRGDWRPVPLLERGPNYVVVQCANESRGDFGIAYVQSTVFTPPE